MSIKSKISTSINGSAAANLDSGVIDIRFNYGYAVVATFTGSPTGTVVVQASIDQVNWVPLDTLTISGLSVLTANRDAVYYPYIKITKAAGGTGTATVMINIKGA